jgi:hypothetical protein
VRPAGRGADQRPVPRASAASPVVQVAQAVRPMRPSVGQRPVPRASAASRAAQGVQPAGPGAGRRPAGRQASAASPVALGAWAAYREAPVERHRLEVRAAWGAWAACRGAPVVRHLLAAWGAWAACRGAPVVRHLLAAWGAWEAWEAWEGGRAAWGAFLRSCGFLIVGVCDKYLMTQEHIAILHHRVGLQRR